MSSSMRADVAVAVGATPEPGTVAIPDAWEVAIRNVVDTSSPHPPVAVVCGAKNTGKSTLSRVLVNRLLSLRFSPQRDEAPASAVVDNQVDPPRVAFLETDLGQPEFTPPGCVSLTLVDCAVEGRPCSHLRSPELSFYVGDTSPKRHPGLFLDAIARLMLYYDRNFRSGGVPLVVNTHGWVVGLGKNLLEAILHSVRPSVVINIQDPAKAHLQTLPDAMPSNPTVVTISPVAHAKAIARIPADQARFLAFAAYFCGTTSLPSDYSSEASRDISTAEVSPSPQRKRSSNNNNNNNALSIAEQLECSTPYRISLEDVKVVFMEDTPHELCDREILQVLNASLVALCISSDAAKGGDSQRAVPSMPCVGMGIVRAVDEESNSLLIVTPVSQSVLARVDTFVLGAQRFPMDHLYSERGGTKRSASQVARPYLALDSIHASNNIGNKRNLRRRRLD